MLVAGAWATARAERAQLRAASPDDEALHNELRQSSWSESVTYREALNNLNSQHSMVSTLCNTQVDL